MRGKNSCLPPTLHFSTPMHPCIDSPYISNPVSNTSNFESTFHIHTSKCHQPKNRLSAYTPHQQALQNQQQSSSSTATVMTQIAGSVCPLPFRPFHFLPKPNSITNLTSLHHRHSPTIPLGPKASPPFMDLPKRTTQPRSHENSMVHTHLFLAHPRRPFE
jgi:hypothetical protein